MQRVKVKRGDGNPVERVEMISDPGVKVNRNLRSNAPEVDTYFSARFVGPKQGGGR